jgi:hypothetical protein
MSLGATVRQDARTKLLVVNEHFKMRLIISPCRARKRFDRWKLHLHSPLKPDVTLIARLASENKSILDYLYVPGSERAALEITVGQIISGAFKCHRHTDLTFLKDIAANRPYAGG